jgi:cytochrome c oxidase subunit 4
MNNAASESRRHGSRAANHVLPLKTYLGVYVALIALTFVTVQVSLLDLGTTAIYVAMAVAIIKASLVAAYFMHLKFDSGFNRLIFVGSLLFLAIFFGLTMADLGTRQAIQEVQGFHYLREEKEALERRDKRPPAPAPAPPRDRAN